MEMADKRKKYKVSFGRQCSTEKKRKYEEQKAIIICYILPENPGQPKSNKIILIQISSNRRKILKYI